MVKWFINELCIEEKIMFISLMTLGAIGIGYNVMTLINIHNALH